MSIYVCIVKHNSRLHRAISIKLDCDMFYYLERDTMGIKQPSPLLRVSREVFNSEFPTGSKKGRVLKIRKGRF